MTKKQLIAIIQEAVQPIIQNEMLKMKKMVKKAVNEEFNRLLNEAESVHGTDQSLTQMINEERDPVRERVEQKIFQGNDPISSVLNQTANSFATGEANPANYGYNSEALAAQMGYETPPQSKYSAEDISKMSPAQKIAAGISSQDSFRPKPIVAGDGGGQIMENVINADFRDMMQILNKKAEQVRPSAAAKVSRQGSATNLSGFHDKTDKYEKEYEENKR